MKAWFLVLLTAALCGGWVQAEDGDNARPTLLPPGGLLLFYGGRGPMSYTMPTPRDVPKNARLLGELSYEDCQQGIFIPIQLSYRATSVSSVFGDASFSRILSNIRKQHPEVDGIFDIRVDRRQFSILGIYRRACTDVVARSYSTHT